MARRQPRRQTRQPDRRRTREGAAAARAAGERSRLVVARLRHEAARILDIEPAALPLDRSLLSLGLDSLSAAELAAAIAAGMGVELPLDSLLQGPSLEDLGEQILVLLAVADAALPAAVSDAALPAAVADAALPVSEAALPAAAEAALPVSDAALPAAAEAALPAAAAADAALPAAPVAGGGGAGRFPLSWGQRALWLLDRMVPGGNPAYVIGGAARIRGEVDVPRLRQALWSLAERHPALRSTVVEDGDAAFQVVHDEPRLAFTSEEAAGWSEAKLRQRLGEAAQLPFDLAQGPLLRVALFRRTATEHLVALAVHHVVADFWSLGILVEELGALYGGRRLPALAGSYASFVRGQTARMAGAAGERLAAFWQAALPPGNPALELPTDRPRPPLPGFRGGSRALSLAPALTASVHALGRRQAATPFMTLLAAFQVLLHRHSGQEEVLVGTPTAGRGSPDLDGVVGYFVNPVVLRGDLRGEPSFATLLRRVRQTAIAAFAHQDYPFPLLVERRGGERDPGRSPVFQVMFVFYREARQGARGLAGFGLGREGARLDLGGLALESVHLPRRSAELDLTLRMAEIDGSLAAELQFDADLFDAATALRMLAQLRTLLAGAVVQPERGVGELPLLDAGERQQLLEWNDTLVPYGTERCLHQLIEAQARRTPAVTAVTDGGERLSYRDLNRRANRLARRLRRLGVGREAVVAVCVERSPAMAVGLLAVLKAGGAYLPLDPGDPPERLRFMLADSGARVLLTGGAVGRRLARRGKAGPATLRIDEPPARRGAAAAGEGGSDRNLAASGWSAGPDNLAYVIYTSGSTGRPKATMNTHRGIVNRLLWMQQQYRLTAGDRVLQKTPFTFDVSVWELFWPLLAGARLVMARPGGHRDPAYLAATIAAEEITVLHFVPAMLRAFLEGAAAAGAGAGDGAGDGAGTLRLPALRRVMASGEALSFELQQLYHAAIAAPLHNLYGPTEAAVDVTHWTCDPDRPRVVPIGRPVANTRIHLLDRAGREVPIGVTAELHIGGVQLARGYLGRADLTAEKFVPDPLAPSPGARLYRTGDLARYLPDGAIEYLGRSDHQVKIRGFRIELGEIEAALRRLPGVREAVVLALDDGGGGKRLVASVVTATPGTAGTPRTLGTPGTPGTAARPGTPGTPGASAMAGTLGAAGAAALRAALERSLPAHMVPAAFAFPAQLPLQPNGKVDRKALRAAGWAPAVAAAPADAGQGAPRTADELLLARLWSEVLSGEAPGSEETAGGGGGGGAAGGEGGALRIGTGDSFFALGGHSLSGARMLARLRQETGVELPLRCLFEAPVLAELAERLAAARTQPAASLPSPALPALPATPGRPVPALPASSPAVPAVPPAASANPLPSSFALGSAAPYVAPRTADELLLARLWSEALSLAPATGVAAGGGAAVRVGVDDGFFSLGGHSLSGARMLVRLRQETGVELPLRCLFDAPTPAGLARQLAAARARRTAASVPGAAMVAAASPAVVEIAEPAAVGRSWPLSFAQRRLWLLAQLEPDSAAYNMAGAVRIEGGLDVAGLSWALDELVRRHAVLRTSFGDSPAAAAEPGEPLQAVRAPFHLPLPVIDLAALTAGAREPEARRLAEAAARRPFALAGGRLLRTLLLRRGGESHLLLVTLHHIVSDGRSHAIFLRDLAVLYERAHGRAPRRSRLPRSPRLPRPPRLPAPPALPCQYGDWADWERRTMREAPPAAALAYWRDRLGGPPPALALPADRPPAPREGAPGGRVPLALPAALAGELTVLGRRFRATPFMVLLAALECLLHRLTGQTDFVVGTVVDQRAGRGEGGGEPPPVDDLIGCFVNTLVLRADLTGSPTFGGLLERVRDATLADLAHQWLPFDRLVEELAPRRGQASPAAAPAVVQVLLALQMDPLPPVTVAGLVLDTAAVETGTAKFDLTFDLMRDRAGGFGGSLEYRRDLFDAASAARLAGQLLVLVTGIAGGGGRRLDELPLHSAAEWQQLLEWNDTLASYPADHCLHQLIEEQARRTPAATAVTAADESLSYRDLNRRANRLARRLRQAGVGREAVVAICVERSLAMVVGLLAILKAGGAYLPLDPGDPPERLRFMLADSGARVLLTGGGAGRWLARRGKPGPVALRIDEPAASREVAAAREDGSARNLAASGRSAGPDNLAYVIYTSGSTGRPKATMNTHRGIVNRLLWGQLQDGLTAGDRVLQKTPFTFDVSVWELFWPLLAGARLVMARPGGHRDPDYLRATIAEQGITVLHFVPAMLRAFLDGAAAAGAGDGTAAAAGGGALRLPTLRRVMASGEALSYELQQRYHAVIAAPLHNLYGPTEAAVEVTHWICDPDRPRVVPIGRPVANTRIHLLDRGGREVPIGVTGELHIGGVQLARGYLGRADLTAEKFVPDAFSICPGARLYSSGDLARYLPDGAIEYLGRDDHQVKIRGFRIELGEIEAALRRQPGVREAVVLALDDGGGGKRLVASVVTATPATPGTQGTPGAPAAPSAAVLRAALERSLPAHMVPAAFAFPAQLPLQPNGKVDRRALQAAAWDPAAAAAAATYVAPRTADELLLAKLWSEVLGFESAGGGVGASGAAGGAVRIGIDDSFFVLGGHSLSGARLLARLRQETGVELPLRCLFEAPSLAELARRLAAARAQRPAAGPAAVVPAAAAPAAADRGGAAAGRPLPLSFAQRRLWLVAQMEPDSAAYNIAGAVRIAGALDVASLSRALDGLVRRHEALRTTFGGVPAAMGAAAAASAESVGGAGSVWQAGFAGDAEIAGATGSDGSAEPGEPFQVILAPFRLPLPVIDLAALPEQAREPAARRLTEAAARRPFALAGGRLLRTSLLRCGGESHLLLVTLHHIVSDGRSHAIFLRDLAALYGRARLPALPCQYADWARWERRSLRDAPPAAALAYWRDRLAGLPPVLALPADRQRPPHASSRGGRAPLALSPALAGELTALARRCRATPFMVLLAALDVLLHRLTGQTDLAVGTVVDQRAGRGEGGGQPPPAGDLIGCFVNTLLLRADLAGNPSFDGLLERVRDAVLADLAQQQLPFDLLVEELAPRRGQAAAAAAQALVQVMLAVQMDPLPAVAAPGLVLETAAVETGTAKFDLTLDLMRDRAGGLGGSLEYRRDLFDAASATRLAGQFQALLAGIAAGAGRRLDELPLHSAAERHQLLVEWGESAAAYPRQSSIHELFAIQARHRPEAIAVVFGATQLSYDELRRRGNRLARRLRRMGVGLEVPVALWVERSPEMVVALLGALAAGGAYVPLDPSFPPQRLRLILAQTGAPVMLTQRRLRGRLAAGVIGEGLQVLCLDDEAPALAGESDADLDAAAVGAGPDDLAYVMYTSGSTGVPKGVAVRHRGVVRLVRATWFADLGSDQVFLQLAPLAFDASTLEIWGPLLGGGRLAIFPPGPPDPRLLGEAVARHGVTTLWLTAGLFHQLVDANPRGLRGLRQLLAGGDVLSAPHVRRALQELTGGVLVNGYGPTENTTFTACHRLRAGKEQAAGGHGGGGGGDGGGDAPVPIGRPVANSAVYLWDAEGLPVPIGVPGELMAGGDGLARGYLGSPDLTAERFVPDPSGGRRGEPGARLYRSGDLARWLPDGTLQFLGRCDRQVKLRGFRIEPGEIEAALARHPDVAQVAAVLRVGGAGEGTPGQGTPGEGTLHAFVVALPGSWLAADAAAAAGELRALVARELPAYMVPAEVCFLPELPLTANGKVDRNALRERVPQGRPDGEPASRPLTPMEELLAGLWCELLGRGQVGADDDFFQLGGHSLLAVRLGTRLQAVLGVEVPLARLFELSRLRDLALELEQLGRGDRPRPEPIRPQAGGGPAPLSFAQERLWFLDQLAPGSATYNVPAALFLDGRLEVAALAAGLGEIRRRHQVLRSRFLAAGAETLPAEPPSRLPLADLAALPGPRREAEAARLRRAEARRPFDLAGGPPWRAALLRRSAGAHVLLLTLHHIACDGWSVEVLARELAALYAAAVSGAAPALPELPIQYADFARWQRRWLAGETLAAELAWWREQLAGARGEPPPLELPLDRPRPPVPGSGGARRLLHLPPDLAGEVEALARRHGVTAFMTLLAALASLLRRYGGQTDVAVGTPVANRGRPEIQDLVGLFVNTLVLRLDLAGDPGFGDLLARTRRTALAAYAHQDVPFDKLVGELAAHRGPAAAPFFQVFCALQPALPALSWPGVAGGFLDADAGTGTAKFDLSLAVSPAADGGLAAAWTYRTELFDAATVERLAGQWRHLLADAVAAADRRLSELRLLGPAERHQLLVEWNAGGEAGGGDDGNLMHVPFERQAALDPAAVALVAVSDAAMPAGTVRTLTYGELAARAERLAGELRALGVGPDHLVAICAEPSFALIAGLLAILKAGGAYLPLDPAHPPERLAQTLADSGARLVLAERGLASLLPAGARVVTLDGETARPAPAAVAPPACRAHPDNAAYVLYTSGSTGAPKGVVVSHRAVANRLRYQVAADLAPGARVLQRTRLGFDVSVVEVFAPLWSGAVVVLAPPSCQQDPDALARLIVEQRVTNANLPPAMLAALLANEGFRRRSSLRVVVTGADKVPGGLPQRFHAAMAAPAPRLISRYGPTEATISVSGFPCGAEPLEQIVPLGRPIAGARLYLLDGGLRELPVGAPGEICIAGSCLARGYLGRPDLTAAAFLPDPFARGEAAAGGRLYRTGDLGRLRADGTFQFLGRADHQVKIRGFRVELGEIETVLSRHPRLRQAVVVDRDEPATGGRRLVAYVVPRADTPGGELDPVDPPSLRGYLEGKLPAYMLPAAFVLLDALPLTANGKVDRQALPAPPASPLAAGAGAGIAPRSQLERTIAGIWRELLQVEQIGIHDNFFDLGGHSLLLAHVRARLQEALARPVPILDLFRHPTVEALARHLGQPAAPAAAWDEAVRRRAAQRQAALGIGAPGTAESRAGGEARRQGALGGVAVIGLAGRFPGADDVAQFWDNLCRGVESIRRLSAEEVAAIDPGLAAASGYVAADGVLAGVELFDAAFFGLLPTEAELMDPQQRIFLECASDALEDAGCDPERYPGLIGVYAGTGANSYGLRNLLGNPAALHAAGTYQALLSNDKDFLATGTSYRLNLKGPSVTVQCACSTSLAAVHFAVQALLTHDCDVALAGGVRVRVPQHGYVCQEGGILSPDGHCRAFDADAAGTVPGHGAGVVVLKRLADALADGDAVRAVIRGVAMNNDGSHKVGFAAPSVAGQTAVIAAALAMSGIEPRDVSYVEAHGTGTALGDPIEVAALHQAFGGGQQKGSCALGSVKTNVGHLDVASGVASLIKTVLALEHRRIPASLHFERPNPRLDLDAGPFFVNAVTREWSTDRLPRRAGVSNFGIGGTNVHVVLEEAPPAAAGSPGRPWQLLVLSAKTAGALGQASRRLAERLTAGTAGPGLADVAHTLQTGRRQFRHRRAVVCRTAAEAAAALGSLDPARVQTGAEEPRHRPVVFMFPGQGAQHAAMGAGLYRAESGFREIVDRCADLLRPHLGFDLSRRLYPEGAGAGAGDGELAATRLAQPALFTVEYALARLWMAWGVQPAALIGHSLGEYVAACLAGVLTLEDALALVAWRGELIQSLPAGAMLAVPLPEARLPPLLGSGLALAAVNGPASCVVAGETAAVEALAGELAARGVRCRRLRTSHAFHSAMMEPILAAFGERVRQVRLRPPSLPYLSNLTGTWITAEEAVSPAYWVRHLRETVRFGGAIDELWREPNRIFLEVGPGRGLRSLLQGRGGGEDRVGVGGEPGGAGEPRGAGAPLVLSSLGAAGDPRPDPELLLTTLGRLWLAGIEVDWAVLHSGERRRRLALPTYPFERRRHWIEPLVVGAAAGGVRRHGGVRAELPTNLAEPGLAGGPSGAAGPGGAAGPDGGRPELPNPYVAPAGERERAIAALWEEMLGMGGIGAEDDFFDLGGHSMLALHLSSRFEERFGVRLPLAALSGRVTIRLLAGLLPQAAPRRSGLRVVMQPEGARPPIWCVHPIGGATLCYRWLARHLGKDHPFIALQAAGLEEDEPPGGTVESMAARYLEEVLAEQPSGPYLLAGWSFGGLVAYEMSRQLIERGAEVARLVLLDTWLSAAGAVPAPGAAGTPAASRLETAELAGTLGGKRLAALMGWFLSDLAAGAGRDPAQVSGDALPRAGDDPEAFFQRSLERAVEAGVLPSRAVGERLFAVFRAHLSAAMRFVPRPLQVPALLLEADTLLLSPAAAELGLLPPGAGDPRQRWHELIAGPLEVQVVAGDHYTMLRPPHVAALAARLRRGLKLPHLELQAAGLS